MSRIRAIFVTPTSKATGETVTALTLAQNVAADGGEVWFLASPRAAQIVGKSFRNQVRMITPSRGVNQRIWWRMFREVRPNVVVFAEMLEIAFPDWKYDCPIMDLRWLRELGGLDSTLVWIDTLEFATFVRRNLGILDSSSLFGELAAHALRSVLKRMRIILPCPTYEPGPVGGRRGIPYRSLPLPLRLDSEERRRMRARFLGSGQEERGALVLHAVSNWCWDLARRLGLPLYDCLSELFVFYLGDLPKPVTVVSVSDVRFLRELEEGNLKILTLKSMPPAEYDKLLLSADLVLTENMGSYMLGKTLGNVTGVTLINSFTAGELLLRERQGSPLRELIVKMERRRPESIFPHNCYPLRAGPHQLVGGPVAEANSHNSSSPVVVDTLRCGRFLSSPFVRAEIYGGTQTKELFRHLLCNPGSRELVQKHEDAYIERQRKLDDGVAVLKHLLAGRITGGTVLDS